MTTTTKKLTTKQRRFVECYILCFNATQAAIEAGYSKKTAATIGGQNLQKLEIVSEIQKHLDKATARTEVTQDRIINEYARIAFTDLRDYVKWGAGGLKIIDSDTLTEDMAAGVLSVKCKTETRDKGETVVETTEIKLHPKTAALEALGRHLGLFNDKINVTHKYELQLPDDFPVVDVTHSPK